MDGGKQGEKSDGKVGRRGSREGEREEGVKKDQPQLCSRKVSWMYTISQSTKAQRLGRVDFSL